MNAGPSALPAAAPSPATARVAYLVYRVERRLRSRIDEAVGRHGLTTNEYVTLSVLRQRDGASSAQLARLAFVTPQAMGAVISALERRGLIARRPDPRHRRILRASVTPAGVELLGRCEGELDAIEADMLGALDPVTLDLVRGALASCAQSLEATMTRSALRSIPAAAARRSGPR